MLYRRWSFIPAVATLALVPAAVLPSGSVPRPVTVELAAKPVSIDVRVTTAVRPLDLQKFSAGDFGDAEPAN